uniref:Uncharacterized protein n=1 Tax=Ciona savignyi TaxID=51511 RepID=H2YFU8_CIOSA
LHHLPFKLVNPDDVTQTDIDSVVDFIQEDVICTNCNCTTLSLGLVDTTDTVELLKLYNLRVTCKHRKVVARINRCTLVGLGLELLQELVITNATGEVNRFEVPRRCIPNLYTETNRSDLVYRITGDLDVCGAETMSNSTHIDYTYTIRTLPNYRISG